MSLRERVDFRTDPNSTTLLPFGFTGRKFKNTGDGVGQLGLGERVGLEGIHEMGGIVEGKKG